MQQRALAVLFALIAVALVVTAVSAIAGADSASGWIIAVAALAIAGWLASVALSAFRR